MSNFNQIGFSVQSEEDYEDLCLTHADKASVEQETPLGIYLGWQENKDFGPELWIQAEGDSLISMHPYFRGKSEMKVSAVDVIDQEKLTPLDAPLFTWFNPEEGNPDSGETQCLLDMVRFYAFDKKLPSIETVSIAAFAQELSVYDSEEIYNAQHPGFTDEDVDDEDFSIVDVMSLGSFFPVGLFPDEGENPEAIVLFSGTVLETRTLKNPSTQKPYIWALVKTLGGTIDVIVGEDIRKGAPIKEGSVLKGAFWLGADFKE